jgi:hypothetical protein
MNNAFAINSISVFRVHKNFPFFFFSFFLFFFFWFMSNQISGKLVIPNFGFGGVIALAAYQKGELTGRMRLSRGINEDPLLFVLSEKT